MFSLPGSPETIVVNHNLTQSMIAFHKIRIWQNTDQLLQKTNEFHSTHGI